MADGQEERTRGPNGGKPRGLALEGRNGEIWRAVTIYRKTREAVAEEHGISRQRVDQIIADVRENLPPEDVSEMRRESLELYAEMTRRALEIVDLIPAPLVAGKDGDLVEDPDTGEYVRDYSGRIKAMEAAVKFDQERRKLMGLDAAQKIEQTGSVRFELVGVDPAELQ